MNLVDFRLQDYEKNGNGASTENIFFAQRFQWVAQRFLFIFAPVKHRLFIGMVLLLSLAACHGPQHEARQMVRRAELLFDTMPDSTVRLIDSVLRMPVYFEEGKRMDIALLQAEALFGDRGQEISPLMDDEFFDDKPFLATSPELERAADYYVRKKRYDKAAHAALYSGFVQQHYGEKTHAMQSFKDAERYGEMVKDSLTVARAEYWMGKMLYDGGLKQEALALFKTSNSNFGCRYIDRAKALNSMACCYLLCGQNDSTEMCLIQSLEYTNKDHSNHLRHKVLNNYAVLNRLQGNYDLALKNLRMIEQEMDSTEMPFLYLNKAIVFVASNNTDSATCCFNNLKPFLLLSDVKELTKASAYEALSRFAKGLGDDSLALQYRETHEQLLFEVMRQRQEQSIFRIQQQYDYESLQNTLNRRIILRHRIILIISILLFVAGAIIIILQFRHRQMRETEAEMKMQIDTMKQDLRHSQKVLQQRVVNLYKTEGDKAWEQILAEFAAAYPQGMEKLQADHPELTETERNLAVLSFFGFRAKEEADILHLSLHTVSKYRTNIRKKMGFGSISNLFG